MDSVSNHSNKELIFQDPHHGLHDNHHSHKYKQRPNLHEDRLSHKYKQGPNLHEDRFEPRSQQIWIPVQSCNRSSGVSNSRSLNTPAMHPCSLANTVDQAHPIPSLPLALALVKLFLALQQTY